MEILFKFSLFLLYAILSSSIQPHKNNLLEDHHLEKTQNANIDLQNNLERFSQNSLILQSIALNLIKSAKNTKVSKNKNHKNQQYRAQSSRFLLGQSQKCDIQNCLQCQKNYFKIVCKKCDSELSWNPLSNKCQSISLTFQTLSPCKQIQNCATCLQYSVEGNESFFCNQCSLDLEGRKTNLPVNGKCLKMDFNKQNKQSNGTFQNLIKYDFDQKNKEGKNRYDGNKYIRCNAGCKICNSSADFTNCSKCLNGYGLDIQTSTCLKCQDECLTCNGSAIHSCTSCYPGYFLRQMEELNLCQKCFDSNCAVCTSSYSDQCSECKNFYFLSQTKNCQPCLNNCRICSDQSKCSVCLQGYYLQKIDSSTSKCSVCIDGCASCSNFTTCNKCYPGFFYNSQNKCQKCSVNCWKCTSNSVCSQCILGTRLVDSACVTQIYNCAVMNKYNACSECFYGFTVNIAKNICTRVDSITTSPQNYNPFNCRIGQYLNNFICTACGSNTPNCESCNAEGCIKCEQGYFYHPSSKICLLCNSTIIGCLNCQSSFFCTKCMNGYYIEQDQINQVYTSYGNCLKCNDNCRTCNEKQNLCTSCNTGLYLTTSRTCIHENQFNFTITLTYDFSLMSASKMDDVKTALARTIVDDSLNLQAKKKCILINNIIIPPSQPQNLNNQIRKLQANKYTEISGTIAVSSSFNAQRSQTTFQNNIVAGSTLSDILVVSSFSTVPINVNNNQKVQILSSISNTGLIVGGIIGGFLLLFLIGLMIYCIGYRNKSSVNKQNAAHSLNSLEINRQTHPTDANISNSRDLNQNVKKFQQLPCHTNVSTYNPHNGL